MSQSQSKRYFTIQVHPIIESVVLKNLDEDTTSEQIMSKYASITAEKYQLNKNELLDPWNAWFPSPLCDLSVCIPALDIYC